MKTIRALSLLALLSVPTMGGAIGNPSDPTPPPEEPPSIVAVVVATILAVLP